MSEKITKQQNCEVRIALHVQPKASKTEIVGIYQDRLKLRIQAPPVDGKANGAICQFFSKLLSVPKSAVSVVSGESGRSKVVAITGVALVDVEQVLGRLLE